MIGDKNDFMMGIFDISLLIKWDRSLLEFLVFLVMLNVFCVLEKFGLIGLVFLNGEFFCKDVKDFKGEEINFVIGLNNCFEFVCKILNMVVLFIL